MKAIIQLLCGEGDVIERGRVPGGPIITIDEPEDSDVLPPVRVEMRFLPPTGSTIDLDTLRVRWSFIDVTSRVTENLNVSPGGVTGLPSPVNTSSRFAWRTIKSLRRSASQVSGPEGILKPVR